MKFYTEVSQLKANKDQKVNKTWAHITHAKNVNQGQENKCLNFALHFLYYKFREEYKTLFYTKTKLNPQIR